MVKVDKRRLLAVGLCLTAFSGAALADSLDAQRQRYQQIKQAWDSNRMDVVAQLMPTLRDYPLYPYLQYRELTQDLSQAGFSEVNDFIKKNPTLPPARSLTPRFVNELARREDWRTLLAFSRRPRNRWRPAAIITTPSGPPAIGRRPGTVPTTCG